MRAFLYISLSILIYMSYPCVAQEVPEGWNAKTFTIYDGSEYRFDDYSIEYFSLKDREIRCINVLNFDHELVEQFCDDESRKKKINENYGRLFFVGDAFAFSIHHALDEHVGIVVYSSKKIEHEVVSTKWFSSYLELSSTSPHSTIVAYPKDTFTVSLKLKNSDEEDINKKLKETYRLYAVVPGGWEAFIKTSDSRVSSVELIAGEEVSITAEVKISEDIFEDCVISFVAEGGDKFRPRKVRYDIPVTLGKDILSSKLSSSTPEIIASLGEKIDLSLSLENQGYMNKYYNLNFSIPDGWKVTLYQSNLEVSSIKVSGKSSATLKAALEIPSDVSAGKYALTFKAVSGESKAEHEITVFIDSNKTFSKLHTSTPEIITTPGKEIKINLDLENKGHTSEYYKLHSISPEEWDVNFYRNEFKVPRILLSGESSISLVASFKIPNDAPLGEYQVTFIAEQENNTNTKLNVIVFVEGEFDLGLELSKMYTRITAGETKEITARIANKGKTVLTGIEIDIEAPNGWGYWIAPKSVSRIDVGNVADFSISLNPPPDSSIGDYFINIKAKSDQTKSEETKLRVTIQQENSLGIVGIFVTILSLAVLFVIFRKFGRR